jgi:UPF0755 protein
VGRELKQGSTLAKAWFLVCVLSVISAAGVGLLLYEGTPSGEVTNVVFPRGTSLAHVSDILYKEGVIHRPRLFKWLLKISGGATKVRAGEFRFQKDMRAIDALFVLYHDEPIVHQVTIPEGWNVRQIAQILAAAGLVNEDRFLELTLTAAAAEKYHLKLPSLEGFLFPDTYGFSKIDGEERIVDRMVQHTLQLFKTDFKEDMENSNMSIEQVVTLASIVEKETGAPEERELVSSVFHNRLRKGMKLQSDPTTIYGIPDFNGNLTKNDLRTYTPYNTYTIAGLPPGPISNPGGASIKAALRPANTKYLYFVSKNNGHHVFTETYLQHLRHVNDYQVNFHRTRAPRQIGNVTK